MFQTEMTHVLRRALVSRKGSRGTCQTEMQCQLTWNRGERKTGRQVEGQEGCLKCLKGWCVQDWQDVLNYKLALATGACHPVLRGLNPMLLQLLTSSTPSRSSGWGTDVRLSVLWESWQDRSSDRHSQELVL